MADDGRRKKEGKPRDGGALGVLIGQRAPGRGELHLGRVLAWEGAKGQARWRWRGSPCPFGSGRAMDEVHRWRTAGGGETKHREERDGGEGLFVISENSGTSR